MYFWKQGNGFFFTVELHVLIPQLHDLSADQCLQTFISLCAMPTLNKGFLIICFRVVCVGLEGFASASLI